ncbi:MAG TPA: F0F1 ATP synthase subunit A [Candidatus Binatia bacterium]|nr:F0F1 ATP synthase subunit A [Candidatus Binatia bacterium]
MEHPFTWYDLLPEAWQHLLPPHTFFALIAAAVLILFAWRARAALLRAEDPLVPVSSLGVRNIAELLVQLIVSQSDAIIGKQGRKYVPYFGTFFFFILWANLLGLVPGFAPPTGNLNTTAGLALVSFIGYNVIGLREQGVNYLKHFVGPMTTLPARSVIGKIAFLPVLLISVMFFFILEAFSHGFRPVSLSLRLFGNMMGDHQVIEAFIHLTKVVVPVAFYLMGTLVSVIQAFVFTLLSMIYVALAVSHGPDEGHEHPSHH